MCFHSKQSKDAQTLEKRFKGKFKTEGYVPADRYNGFTFPKTPVITNSKPDTIDLYSWGLMPSWSKDQKFRVNTLNARIETLAEKPSFKNCIVNRCLILVDGFFEWKWLDEKGKNKQQYQIGLPNEEPFAFAGIYSQWADKTTGEVLDTYSIITTEANELMAEIHNTKKRMPVILTHDNERDWLNGEDYLSFSKPIIDLIATPI
jgi:putative SOS response-associated peptidase YedK